MVLWAGLAMLLVYQGQKIESWLSRLAAPL